MSSGSGVACSQGPRVQIHLDQVIKVMISLAVPLMSMLKQVLAVMIRVADPEEMDVIQDLVNNMVQDQKRAEKGRHRKKDAKIHHSPRSKMSSSMGSFEVITESSKQSHRSRPASSNQYPAQEKMKTCFCGLTPQLLTCRKEGANFMREILSVPQAIPAPDTMRILRMDGGHQSGGVRETQSPECFFGEAAQVQKHKEEIQARLRHRVQCLQRKRSGLEPKPNKIFSQDTNKNPSVSARVEPQGHQTPMSRSRLVIDVDCRRCFAIETARRPPSTWMSATSRSQVVPEQ